MSLRNRASLQFGESKAQTPLSVLIGMLRGVGSLTAEDEADLKKLLEIRNRLVHGDVRSPLVFSSNAVNLSQKLLKRLAPGD